MRRSSDSSRTPLTASVVRSPAPETLLRLLPGFLRERVTSGREHVAVDHTRRGSQLPERDRVGGRGYRLADNHLNLERPAYLRSSLEARWVPPEHVPDRIPREPGCLGSLDGTEIPCVKLLPDPSLELAECHG